jgi:hypothetical protein
MRPEGINIMSIMSENNFASRHKLNLISHPSSQTMIKSTDPPCLLQYPAKLTFSLENLKLFLELPDVMNVSNSKDRSKMIY